MELTCAIQINESLLPMKNGMNGIKVSCIGLKKYFEYIIDVAESAFSIELCFIPPVVSNLSF